MNTKSSMRFFDLCCLTAFCSLSVVSPAHAQVMPQDNDSTIRTSALNAAIAQYHAFVAPVTALYNGPQYVEYYHSLQVGHPFFQSVGLTMGSLVYDHILYERIPMAYDIVKDKVLIRDPTGNLYLSLFNDKISSFNIFGHNFIRIVKDSVNSPVLNNTGFYDQLYSSFSVQLLKKENKKILEELNAYDGTKRTVYSSSEYFLRLGTSWHKVDSRKNVLALVGDKKARAALRQYIRKNNLDIRNDADRSLISIAAFFDKNR